MESKDSLQRLLCKWYESRKRDFPWRKTHDPYKIWISEICLQQTQASRVVVFYQRIIEKFPTVHDLAQASWEEFLPYFKGLGFYSRGKNILKTAQIVSSEYAGEFPGDVNILQEFPGIGDYTAHAIVSFAFGKSVPALDVNLFRVLGRFSGVDNGELGIDKKMLKNEVRKYAFSAYEKGEGDILNHALMDVGASVCGAKKVSCEQCPLQSACVFYRNGCIVEQKIKPTKKAVKANEFAVLVLRHEKKYLLEKNTSSCSWSFPVFYRDQFLHKNHRHFLQETTLKHFGTEISVRPPFYKEEIDNNLISRFCITESENLNKENISRLQFSRCQILSGEVIETETLQFFSLEEIKKFSVSKLYSKEFLEVLMKMRV